MVRPLALLLAVVAVCAGAIVEIHATKKVPRTASVAALADGSFIPDAGPADLILTNGRIATMEDGDREWATGVASRVESIVAVWYAGAGQAATAAEINRLTGPRTRVIDLHGQFAMPGFNDAHVHLASAAYVPLEINLEGVTSLAEFQQHIRARLKDFGPGEWIIADGWDHTLWPEKRFPTRQDLDAVSTSNPILAARIDGHVAVANFLALKLAGITNVSADPPGGRIERDPKTGEPTGMLDEDAAMDLVSNLVPSYTQAKRAQVFESLFNSIARSGVTSVQDNSVIVAKDSDNYGWENFLVYRALQRSGKLNIRITEWLPFEVPLPRLEQMRRDGDTADPWLKTGALKEVLDGSLGARTAAMLAPYSDDPQALGILSLPPEKLTALAI